jgi:hypothetical protein
MDKNKLLFKNVFKVGKKNTNSWDKAKARIILGSPLVANIQKSWFTTSKKKYIKKLYVGINLTYWEIGILEKVAYHFHCKVIIDNKCTFLVGYNLDLPFAKHYFKYLIESLKGSIETNLEIHKKKSKLERERRRRGAKHKEIINGKVFSSNLRKKYIKQYYQLSTNLLLEEIFNHKELKQLRTTKLKDIKQWKQ